MKIKWTQGLDEQLSKDVISSYKESIVLRKRLKKILEDIIEETRATQCSKTLYESPNWQFMQADKMGYERALRDIISYISD